MAWSDIQGQEQPIQLLRRAAQRGRLGHTLLFAGPPGIGKKQVGLELAKSLLCERSSDDALAACDQCPGCKQVAARTHPDLVIVERLKGKAELLISQFIGDDEQRGKAGLCHELALKPMAGGRKVAIIDDADRLNDESANALLKTLEEPPPHSVLILIASQAEKLLPTIRSRCQTIRFPPLSMETVARLLVELGWVEKETEALEIAAFSDGSLQTAATLLDPQLRGQRQTIMTALAQVPFQPIAVGNQVWSVIEDSASEVAEQREQAQWVIRFTTELLRDRLWHAVEQSTPGSDPGARKSGSSGTGLRREASPAAKQAIDAIWRQLNSRPIDPIETIGQLLERANLTERQLAGNANVALSLESFWSDLGHLFRGSPVPASV